MVRFEVEWRCSWLIFYPNYVIITSMIVAEASMYEEPLDPNIGDPFDDANTVDCDTSEVDDPSGFAVVLELLPTDEVALEAGEAPIEAEAAISEAEDILNTEIRTLEQRASSR